MQTEIWDIREITRARLIAFALIRCSRACEAPSWNYRDHGHGALSCLRLRAFADTDEINFAHLEGPPLHTAPASRDTRCGNERTSGGLEITVPIAMAEGDGQCAPAT